MSAPVKKTPYSNAYIIYFVYLSQLCALVVQGVKINLVYLYG